MQYEEMQISFLKSMKPYWSRVISLDFETHALDPSKFLTNERILSISFSRRISGEMMQANEIETKTFLLETEEDESEINLLKKLDYELSSIRPLCVLGYCHRQYDIPLLCIKKQCYHLLLWKLIDLCESAFHIDLYHILKYKKYKRFEDALSSPEFANLPFKNTKRLVPNDREEKGKEIYRLWKEDREKLRKYAEGDVHDVLLMAESIALKQE